MLTPAAASWSRMPSAAAKSRVALASLRLTSRASISSAEICPTVSPAVYLEITRVSTAGDRDVALDWLAAHDLGDWYAPVRRWLAAFWAAAFDDAKLHGWCRSVLL